MAPPSATQNVQRLERGCPFLARSFPGHLRYINSLIGSVQTYCVRPFLLQRCDNGFAFRVGILNQLRVDGGSLKSFQLVFALLPLEVTCKSLLGAARQ